MNRCGKTHTHCKICRPEVGRKLSTSLLGHLVSTETRAKQARASRGNKYALGNIMSPEAREKISLSLLGNQRCRGTTRTQSKTTRDKIALGHAKARERGDYDFLNPTSLEYALQLLLESAGLEYEAQVRFGRYVVDFWVQSRGLVFEADGMFWFWHQDKGRERRRDAYLRERGVIGVVHLRDGDLKSWLPSSSPVISRPGSSSSSPSSHSLP